MPTSPAALMPLSDAAPDNYTESPAMTLLFADHDIEELSLAGDRYLLPGCELAIALAPDAGTVDDCTVCGQSHYPVELHSGRP